MLDLDAIFNPEQTAAAHHPKVMPVPDLALGPARLPPEWHIVWDERAAILEYDGGHNRETAEALALTEILGLMRRAGISFD